MKPFILNVGVLCIAAIGLFALVGQVSAEEPASVLTDTTTTLTDTLADVSAAETSAEQPSCALQGSCKKFHNCYDRCFPDRQDCRDRCIRSCKKDFWKEGCKTCSR